MTGATGFIGSHTAELLLKKQYSVDAIIRNEKRIEALPEGIEPIVCSLFEPNAILEKIKEVEYFIHIAGATKARKPVDFYNINAETTKKWLEAIEKHAVKMKKFVFISSQAATRPSYIPIDETIESAPLTDYGASKQKAEEYVREFIPRIPITIVRPPAVYGPRDKDIFFYFKLASFKLLPLVGKPDRPFSAIYVEDLAEAIILAMEHPESTGEIFFVTDGEIHTWRSFAEEIGKAVGGKKLKIRLPGTALWLAATIDEFISFIIRRPALLSFQKVKELLAAWVADSSKIEEKLGFKPKYDLPTGAKKTAQWYRENDWIR